MMGNRASARFPPFQPLPLSLGCSPIPLPLTARALFSGILEPVSAAGDREVGDEPIEALRRLRRRRGDDFPRIGLFLFDCPDSEMLRKVLDRIPGEIGGGIEEFHAEAPDWDAFLRTHFEAGEKTS